MIECFFQLLHIVSGKTADGAVSELPKLPVHPDSAIVPIAANMARAILERMAAPEPIDIFNDQIRTAIGWKVAAHISKVGLGTFDIRDVHTAMRVRLMAIEIADFLIDHPKLVLAKTSLAGIQRLRSEELKRLESDMRKAEKAMIAQHVARLQEESGAPPRPVVWTDGTYRLEELIHPFHIWEEGLRMHNCLGSFDSRETRLDMQARDLPKLRYWKTVADGSRYVYSLRQGNKRLSTFTHVGVRITEMQISAANPASVRAPILAAIAFLEGIYGPLRVAAGQPRLQRFLETASPAKTVH